MATYGLLIDYEYCTHCCSCTISCKKEHNYPIGQDGIKVIGDGPWKIADDEWNWNWYPLPTDLCDLCENRTAVGREPLCVHHCLANVIRYGTIEDLSKKLEEKPKQMLIVPQFRPKVARGEFVHNEENETHVAAHIEAYGDGQARYAVHRHDANDFSFETDVDSLE